MLNSSSFDKKKSRIILRAVQHGDDVCEFIVEAHAVDFYVTGSAFFSITYLMNNLDKFDKYPLDKSEIPEISGGYYDEEKRLVSEHVFISVCPINEVGGLIMTVRCFVPDLADPNARLGRGGRCDYRMTYEGLKEFTEKTKELLTGKVRVIEFGNIEN